MSGAERTLQEEIVGMNGESTEGSHHLELGIIIILLLLHGENGRAKPVLGSSWDVEMLLVSCVQKSRNIWTALCACLSQQQTRRENKLLSTTGGEYL